MAINKFSLVVPLVLSAYLLYGVAEVEDRGDAFIGYNEKPVGCTDVFADCKSRATVNDCIHDPYLMRQFCPVACAVSRCTFQGTMEGTIKGYGTQSGTRSYFQRIGTLLSLPETHARDFTGPDSKLLLSSLGVGTYLGNNDRQTDEAVSTAIIFSVSHGLNVIDTASNYRWGMAEEAVGAALSALLAGSSVDQFAADPAGNTKKPDITRDMLFISTKAGFVTKALAADLMSSGKLMLADIVADVHCMHPAYLTASLDLSLKHMKLETVDLLYLHNAAELQLPQLGYDRFMKAISEAFFAMEGFRDAGKIRYYGLATWDAFRVPPGHHTHLNLEDVVALAENLKGFSHGFRFIQLPVNVQMTEFWHKPWQRVQGVNMTVSEAAQRLGIGVFASSPLGEGALVKELLGQLDGVKELVNLPLTSMKLLQVSRSAPGLLSSLVGHKTKEYVLSNMDVTLVPPLATKVFNSTWHHMVQIINGN